MAETILITGASGLIGKSLTKLLLQKGYAIHHLSRNRDRNTGIIKTFNWDVYSRSIDQNCIKGVDAIIHLAGEGIADKRWTTIRKKQITESRTESIRLIYDLLRKIPHQVKTVISASGISYYGDQGNKLLAEENPPTDNFLAQVCVEWEKAVDEGGDLGLRIVKFRTGIVLDREEGALVKLAMPVKYGLGTHLGSGKQWVPWIHLDDTLRMYLFALENPIKGTYNMVAPNPVTNRGLIEAIAAEVDKPLWLPGVPAFSLKIILGEMSTAVLESIKASAGKIQSDGFIFRFPEIKHALQNIYSRRRIK